MARSADSRQAADDTRAVINFMHTFRSRRTAVPRRCPATPIPNPTEQYDLSISDKSGLKVPKQVVATTEGREFVVSVANAGPDTAAGTVIRDRHTADGGDVLVDGTPGPFVFEFEDLLAGMTYLDRHDLLHDRRTARRHQDHVDSVGRACTRGPEHGQQRSYGDEQRQE